MIVRDFDIHLCTMRKEDPNWRFALGANPVTDGQVLRIATDDGIEGFGYASATPHMGSIQATLQAELELFRPFVIGRDPRGIEAILIELDRCIRGAPQAKAAVDCALHDLLARTLGVPLNVIFGGPVRDSVPILRILAIKTPQEMAIRAEARRLRLPLPQDQGAWRGWGRRRAGGGHPASGRGRHPSHHRRQPILLAQGRLSQRFTVRRSTASIWSTAGFAGDLAGLALVTRVVPTIVEADESAGSLNEIFKLVTERVIDAVSLKIPKLGGLRNTLAAARLCEAGHIKYRLGAAVGSRLLAVQALHLACALPGVDYACELGEFDRLLDDPFEGIEVVNGMLRLPDGPGSGVRLRSSAKVLAQTAGSRIAVS